MARKKTRYNKKELAEFEKLITGKLDIAKQQLQFYMDQMADKANSSDAKIRGLDDGNGTAESERVSIMAGRQRKLIQHLENALRRIQNNAYGVCRVTGELIAKERLRAVPHATLSIKAKQEQSRN